MSFRVGQKVVCVDSRFHRPSARGINRPIEGEIYHIRSIIPADFEGPVSLLLIEIVNPKGSYWREPSFLASRFRPIDYSFGEEKCAELEKELIPETVEI
jgi:hypothetical protein